VLDTRKMLDDARITEQRAALCAAAGQAFYNTSKFTLRDLKSRGSQQQLLADFEDYLNGFSPNVQDILDNFKFRNQLQTLSKADAIGTLINKFLDPDIDLSPAGIDNHSMGTVFEELVRKFNEENNEEAGEHWTPRDAVRLMANLVFLPIEAEIKSGTYLLYDCACGTGGMLTVAEETLTAIAARRGQQVRCLLYGQEINPETYAVCKADMLLKGEGESADHIVGGAEWSTLAHDAFPAQEFDFMLANPPYGKSWKKDLEAMGGKDGMRDPRFKVMHDGEELSLVTRSSDGQMLFLANMASKMNGTVGARQPHRRSAQRQSLFTGDAGQGESNIRRWLIENDWLEAIVALPLNLFYNTGIATYIWVLSNRKPAHRQGRCSSSTPASGSSRCARTSARRTANSRPRTSSASAAPSSISRKRPSRRSSPTPPSATGRSPSSARCACTASFRSRPSKRCASTPATRTCAPRCTMSSATTCSRTFRQGSAALGAAPRRLGQQRRGRRRRRRGRRRAKKGLPEKQKKKLLDARTWERDGRLVEVATRCARARRDALRGPQRLPRPRRRRAQGGRASSSPPPT
jgi:type I restriction enzyme M protein